MIIKIAQMALSYYLNKLRKVGKVLDGVILRALHKLAATSAGQLKAFKWFKAPSVSRFSAEACFLWMAVRIWDC